MPLPASRERMASSMAALSSGVRTWDSWDSSCARSSKTRRRSAGVSLGSSSRICSRLMVMDGLFAAAGTWYQRDKPFVQALADNRDLDPFVIARRLKGEIEFREKLSAFLVIIAGGASFSGLGAIWDSLVKGHPNPWVILPTAGLAMTTILLQTLFIAARIKGDLLVCLEEAE